MSAMPLKELLVSCIYAIAESGKHLKQVIAGKVCFLATNFIQTYNELEGDTPKKQYRSFQIVAYT